MDPASLRIKFTPLLKSISSGDPDSKCCIEIVPELSAFQNLDKLKWKLKDNNIEYTIPMTYKIIIKKYEQVKNETEIKVYHSCVDLLHTCSISNTNFAAGDITGIISDNFILRKVPQRKNKCELLFNKDLFCTKDFLEKIIARKSASIQTIQTLNIYERHSSLSSHRPHIDKSLEINLDDNVKSHDSAIAIDEKFVKVEDQEKTESSMTFNVINEDADLNDQVNDLKSTLKSFYKKHSQPKLTLSPICSINTYDMFPTKTVYDKSNASSYAFQSSSPSRNNLNKSIYESKAPNRPGVRNEIIKNLVYNTSNQIQHLYETSKKSETENAFRNISYKVKTLEPHNVFEFRDMTSSRTKLATQKIGYRNNMLKKEKYLEPNNVTITNVNIYDIRDKRKVLNKTFEPETLLDKDNMCNVRCKENKIICSVDYNMKRLDRIRPEIRVANFVQNLEKEIYPLKMKLNEIKWKCTNLGIFCGDFMPIPKSIMYKSMPNFNDDLKESRKRIRKPNRVVYTVLFNG